MSELSHRPARIIDWRGPRVSSKTILFVALLIAVLYLAAAPLLAIIYGALTTVRPGQPSTGLTLEKLVAAYTSPRLWGSAGNTVVYALGVTLIAVPLGGFLAWVVERTNTPLRNAIFVLALVRLIMPGILITISWIFLLGPSSGAINQLARDALGIDGPLINIFSLQGMILIEGFKSTPLAFLLMASAFRASDPSYEEASRASGAGMWRTLRHVSVPLLRPALVASFVVVFVTAFEDFETPALLGLRSSPPVSTLSTEVFITAKRSPIDFNLSSAYSTLFLIAAMVGLIAYWRATRSADRFATITGRGYRPNRMDLGRWRWPTALLATLIITVGFVLPMAILLWRSLMPFTATPSFAALERLTLESYEFVLNYPDVGQGLTNSLIVATASGAIAVLLTTLACWFVLRTRVPGRRVLDLLMFLPIGIPGLVLGLALLWIYLGFIPVLYATLWVLILAHITRFMPYAMRFSTVSLTQVHSELEEASRAAGGSMLQTLRRILIPLIAPGLIAAFVFVFMASFRELSASFLLVNVGTRTIPTVVFELWDNTSSGPVAALGILVGAMLVGVVIVARAIGLRLGIRQ